MIFTQEQIDEIEQKLTKRGAKDTQLPSAKTPLTGDESIAIVQERENRLVPVGSIVNTDGGIFNVSEYLKVKTEVDTSVILTLSEAIEACPSRVKKAGQIITFIDKDKEWQRYQYQGYNVENWNQLTLWKDLNNISEDIPVSEDVMSFNITEYMPGGTKYKQSIWAGIYTIDGITPVSQYRVIFGCDASLGIVEGVDMETSDTLAIIDIDTDEVAVFSYILFVGNSIDGYRYQTTINSDEAVPDWIAKAFGNNSSYIAANIESLERRVNTKLNNKVDKIQGKGLSTNDFTNTNVSELANSVTNATYNSNTKKIVFTKNNSETIELDATPFIKDGMVNSVSIVDGYLVITFNTDSGKETIRIALVDIFNPANYYDKDDVDGLLAGKVDKETGKGLSTNDYTDSDKGKLSTLPTNSELTTLLNGKADVADLIPVDNIWQWSNTAYLRATNIQTLDGVWIDKSATSATKEKYIYINKLSSNLLVFTSGYYSYNFNNGFIIPKGQQMIRDENMVLGMQTALIHVPYSGLLSLWMGTPSDVASASQYVEIVDSENNVVKHYSTSTLSQLSSPIILRVNSGNYYIRYFRVNFFFHSAMLIRYELPLSELLDDSTHRLVSDDEKTAWNNKSNFSGSYNDLSDKPDLSGFITNSVDNLVNYYLKSETYTKTEVQQLIGAIQQFHYEVYPTLPQTGASNVLYLIGPTGSGSDKYEEYVYANNDWTKIGDTSIDLSGYVTTEALNTALADYVTSSALSTALANYYNKTEVAGLLAAKVNTADLARVATSGSYNDLSDKPTLDDLNKDSELYALDNSNADYIAAVDALRTQGTGIPISHDIEGAKLRVYKRTYGGTETGNTSVTPIEPSVSEIPYSDGTTFVAYQRGNYRYIGLKWNFFDNTSESYTNGNIEVTCEVAGVLKLYFFDCGMREDAYFKKNGQTTNVKLKNGVLSFDVEAGDVLTVSPTYSNGYQWVGLVGMSITNKYPISRFRNDAGYLTQHQDISGKADKSEMSVVPGTGADADKTTITLKQGTSATVLTAHQDISGKEDVTTIVTPVNATDATLPITTLTCEVGKYYRIDVAVDTLGVTLPAMTDLTTVRTVVICLTAGTTPAVTITTADNKDVYYQDGYEIEAGSTYEINALFNGAAWIVAAVKINVE